MRDITLRPLLQDKKNIFSSFLLSNSIQAKEIKQSEIIFDISVPNTTTVLDKIEQNGENQFFAINYQIKNLPGTEDFLNRISYDNSYNYFFQTYEEIGKEFGEQELPELYSIIARNDFKELIKVQSRQYFIDFINNFDKNNSKKEIKEVMTYIDSDVLDSESGLRNSFPYYNHIRINTIDKNRKFAKRISTVHLLDEVCKLILNNFMVWDASQSDKVVPTKISSKFVLQSYQSKGMQNGELDKESISNLFKFDIEEDFDKFYKKIIKNPESKDYTQVSKKTRGKSFINPFSIIKIKNELEKSKDSTILDLYNTKDADVVMYEIKKFREGKFVSNYFIPAHKEQIDFYDTQIVEDVEYHYEISAFCLISGLNLFVNNIKKENIVSKSYRADYTVTPDFYFLRIPWDNTEKIESEIQKLYLKNAPPLSPELDIIPNERKSDSVRINLKKRDGTEVLVPQIIDSKEKAAVEKYKKIYNFNDFKYKVKYQADDSGTIFEVYKTTEPPEKYSDFSPTEISRIYQDTNESFLDDVQPNRTYYYCARMTDINGNLSNPTKIWKIKIESNEGQLPVLVKDIYEFPKQIIKTERSFQKYVMIKPTSEQERLNNIESIDSASDYINPQMGSVFGKQYRVEVTSKHTGKKIDVILQIKTPMVRNEINPLPKTETNTEGSEIFDYGGKHPVGKVSGNKNNKKEEVLSTLPKISLNDDAKEAYDPGPIKFPIIPAK